MSDLDIIKAIEKHIGEELKPCELSEVMNASSRAGYVLNALGDVIALNLQSCKLTKISFIKALKNLTKVNLALNNITRLTSLAKLVLLDELNVQKNEIVDLEPLERLEELKKLNLQANKITNVEPLYNLSELNELNLSSNEIVDFEALGELAKLTHLDLSDNQVSALSPLKTMGELVELDLRFNKISSISGLSYHKKLMKLFLSTNEIIDIDLLNNLPALTQLYLSSNKVRDISAIANLSSLVLLDLRSNKIDEVASLENLVSLTHLHLESNEITDISVFKNLINLTQLNLRHNQVSNIDSLKGLKQLTHLYLSDNEIKVLPKWILDFKLPIKWNTGGQGISVIANPIQVPPPEVIRQGNTGIKNFFNTTQKRALNKVKVLLVGDCGVGKTSLSKVLRDLPFDAEEAQTLGINIESWVQEDVCANLWDFGGERSLLATHKFFFSERNLYILVLDNSEQRNEERWLKRIESFGGDSSVLIVLNKFDEDNSYDVDRKYLLHRYKRLRGIFPVSCAQGVGLDAFKHGLISAFQHVPIFNSELSESCFKIKAALEKQQKQLHCIPYEAFIDICDKQGYKDKKMQLNLLQLLHDLGVTIHFKDPDASVSYLLEPQWITQALYKITTAEKIAANKGILYLNDLTQILKAQSGEDYDYSDAKHSYLIELMKTFNLCCQVDDDSVLIPQLLNKEKPEVKFDESNALQFQIQYNYLDESVMPRLIVALYQQIEIDKSSRCCIFLKNTEMKCNALLEVDYDNDAVYIKINGKDKRDYFELIRKTLYSIHW
ncbi:MAG: hypothetical protein GQ569_04160 [Methylococcaceae bacterium]|nr:hypothetical protein [Methylococcaceae bacterium]